MRVQIAFTAVAVLSISILASCSNKEKKRVSEEKAASEPPLVEVVYPQKNRPVYTLSLPGELKPYEQVAIFAKAKGFIKKVFADRGSKVKKGQLLALLEAPELSQQLLSLRSDERKLYENFLYSKAAYRRLRKAALKDDAVAAIELDKARAQLRSDSAAYMAAKASTGASAQLAGYLRIVAPFEGTVTSRNVSAGALVGENSAQPLFYIAQQEYLRLTVAIPEKHSHSVSGNTTATFTVSDLPGKVYRSKLSRNSGLLDQSSRSVMVEFDVDNRDESLNGGEFAQVQLSLQRPDSTVWLPASGVVHAQSGVFILKVRGRKIIRVPVTEGIRKDSLQEVFGEVSPADPVVKKGTEELEEGTLIHIK